MTVRAKVEARAARWRGQIAEAMGDFGDVVIEGEAVRVSGRGIMRRWMADARLRDAGRAGR
jgi:hypothetical protein